jgi:hypothetical protein
MEFQHGPATIKKAAWVVQEWEGLMQGDFPVSKMVSGLPGVDPKRKAKLLEVLDVDPDWRMHMVSDGQRRRVQLLMGLLKPFEVNSLSFKLFVGLLNPFQVNISVSQFKPFEVNVFSLPARGVAPNHPR